MHATSGRTRCRSPHARTIAADCRNRTARLPGLQHTAGHPVNSDGRGISIEDDTSQRLQVKSLVARCVHNQQFCNHRQRRSHSRQVDPYSAIGNRMLQTRVTLRERPLGAVRWFLLPACIPVARGFPCRVRRSALTLCARARDRPRALALPRATGGPLA